VRGRPAAPILSRLARGVDLEDGPARFDRITAEPWNEGGGRPERGPGRHGPAGQSSFRIVLHEGRNREVRRLWEAVGFEVSRLRRVRYGPIELPENLRPGAARLLAPALVVRLAAAVEPQPGASREPVPARRR